MTAKIKSTCYINVLAANAIIFRVLFQIIISSLSYTSTDGCPYKAGLKEAPKFLTY